MEYQYTSGGPELTKELGFVFSQLLTEPTVMALDGPVGAGKTCFIQGLAAGLGISGPVNSPTYTIVNFYEEGKWPFYHCDCYRLGEKGEIEDLGFDEFMLQSSIVAFEWARVIKSWLPNEYIGINFAHIDENTRLITFTPYGEYNQRLVKQLINYLE